MLSHSKQFHESLKKAKAPSFRLTPIVNWLALVAIRKEPSQLPCLATPHCWQYLSTGSWKKSL